MAQQAPKYVGENVILNTCTVLYMSILLVYYRHFMQKCIERFKMSCYYSPQYNIQHIKNIRNVRRRTS